MSELSAGRLAGSSAKFECHALIVFHTFHFMRNEKIFFRKMGNYTVWLEHILPHKE